MQYPVNLNLHGRRCLVVGAGRIALRKVEQLLAAGATVTVIAPEVHSAFESMTLPNLSIERRRYSSGDVTGFRLVITATGDRRVDQLVFDEAENQGIWVNSADDPDRCSFTLPASVRRGPLLLTASTGGASPALSAWLRRQMEHEYGDEWADVVRDLALERARIHHAGQSTEDLDWTPIIERVIAERIAGRAVGTK